jgi:hypothetical protein
MSRMISFRNATVVALGIGILATAISMTTTAGIAGQNSDTQDIRKHCYRYPGRKWDNPWLQTFNCRDERALRIPCVDTECVPPPPPVILYSKKGGKEDGGERSGKGSGPNSGSTGGTIY